MANATFWCARCQRPAAAQPDDCDRTRDRVRAFGPALLRWLVCGHGVPASQHVLKPVTRAARALLMVGVR